MISHIGYLLRVLLDAQRLRVIGHLGQLAFGFLKVRVVLHIRLDLRVLRDPLQLGRVRDRGRLRLRDVAERGGIGLTHRGSFSVDSPYLRLAIREFVESFVRLHVQHHAAFGAFEACFVPRLQTRARVGQFHDIMR